MRVVSRVTTLAVVLLPLATAPAWAQTWKWDLNLNGGYSYFTPLLKEDQTGVADDDVAFKPAPLLGAQLTFWPSSRFAIRANGTYAETDLETENDVTQIGTVNLWSGTGDLLFRFTTPRSEFNGLEVLPYLAAGVGLKWVNPAGEGATCTDSEGDTFNCHQFTPPGSATAFALAEKSTLMGLVGLGADWRLARNFAIRTEIGDRLWDPPVHQVTAAGPTVSDDDVGPSIHELYGQIGLSFLFGVARPPVVAVMPPPAPPPVVTAPVMAERREAITVCVVDPTVAGGIRMQPAYLIEGRDTVITVSGMDRPFNQSVGSVLVASNADWYVRGQPLTLYVGRNRVEYATYGSARVVEAHDLAFVGTINGMPVYADRVEVQDFIGELNDLNRARPGTDLGRLLEQNPNLRAELDDVRVLYVPLHPAGCVFQAVQRQEEVRKSGK